MRDLIGSALSGLAVVVCVVGAGFVSALVAAAVLLVILGI